MENGIKGEVTRDPPITVAVNTIVTSHSDSNEYLDISTDRVPNQHRNTVFQITSSDEEKLADIV